jgi:hypothetical protein
MDQRTDKFWRQTLATNFGDFFYLGDFFYFGDFFALKVIWGPTNGPTDGQILATNFGDEFWRLFFTLATFLTLATF